MYSIICNDESFCCSVGKFKSIPEAVAELRGTLYDVCLEMAAGQNVKFEWADDGSSFTVSMWSGDDEGTAEDYFEREYYIVKEEGPDSYEVNADGERI